MPHVFSAPLLAAARLDSYDAAAPLAIAGKVLLPYNAAIRWIIRPSDSTASKKVDDLSP